jgi:hypothetical protein
MTRNQRRQLQKLADPVDRVVASDRKYFERFPHRQHRIRLASQAEIESAGIMQGEKIALAPDEQLYIAVKSIAPGSRLRLAIVGPRDAATDLPEDLAQALYELARCDKVRAVEAQMRLMAWGTAQ